MLSGAGLQLFEYVDKRTESSVGPLPEGTSEKERNERHSGEKNHQTRKRRKRQDGGQTEDPNGERETQQEHHSARKRGQVNGEFNNRYFCVEKSLKSSTPIRKPA